MSKEHICQADYCCSDKREEIVRCRDCRYWEDDDYCINPQWHSSMGSYEWPCTLPEFFCADGERRNE